MQLSSNINIKDIKTEMNVGSYVVKRINEDKLEVFLKTNVDYNTFTFDLTSVYIGDDFEVANFLVSRGF